MTARAASTLQRLISKGSAFTMSAKVVTEIFAHADESEIELTVCEFQGGFFIKFAN